MGGVGAENQEPWKQATARMMRVSRTDYTQTPPHHSYHAGFSKFVLCGLPALYLFRSSHGTRKCSEYRKKWTLHDEKALRLRFGCTTCFRATSTDGRKTHFRLATGQCELDITGGRRMHAFTTSYGSRASYLVLRRTAYAMIKAGFFVQQSSVIICRIGLHASTLQFFIRCAPL